MNESFATSILILPLSLISSSSQMRHAAPPWAMLLYVWSWILLAFFILVLALSSPRPTPLKFFCFASKFIISLS
jgi:hypothetical protein